MTAPLPSTHRSEAAQALQMAADCRNAAGCMRLLEACGYKTASRHWLDMTMYYLQLAHQHTQAAPRLP